MDNFDFPIGADDINAPWNKENNSEQEIEVFVSITMSKSAKIKVSDYEKILVTDEDGTTYEDFDFSKCDLKSAVHKAIINKDLESWNIDNFEVTLD